MLTKANVDEVLVQATYMSGDRNAIASALRVKPKLGVVILVAADAAASADELLTFYRNVAGTNRVAVHRVPRGTARDGAEAVRLFYRSVDDHAHGKGGRPAGLDGTIEKAVKVQSATWGTEVIKQAFGKDATAARNAVRRLWRLDKVKTSAPVPVEEDLRRAVRLWLRSKGFRLNRQYVFLFAKQGARTAEKAHHFTSILTWRILQERISRETPVIPVATGDPIGLRTIPTMVEFWNDTAWKKIFENHTIDPRAAQLGMWCLLAEELNGVSIVGMRSGMIEVPALVGIRTLYLEEAHNQQAKRMAKWLGKVPGYARQVVNAPPGIAQQVYWNKASLSRKPGSPDRLHAEAHGGHLAGLVQGHRETGKFTKATETAAAVDTRRLARTQADTLDLDPEEARPLVHPVFGTGGLARSIDASKFMLESSEFDKIVEWAGNSPKPKDHVDASHGAVVAEGPLVKRDVAAQDLVARRAEKSWGEFFASKEYRDSLPATVT